MLFLRPDLELPCVGARTAGLRSAVRAFVADEIANGRITPRCNAWTESLAPDFSRRLGERGWIGYHWPTQHGGRGGSAFDTPTINEELLAAGAPVGAHWIAARQSAPLLMCFGNEAQRQEFLPRVAGDEALAQLMADALPLSPTCNLRGGSNEVLRNRIAKNLQGK